jgi:hypothetical protein
MIKSRTYVVANIESLGDPVVGNATKSVRETVYILGSSTSVGVYIASKTGTVFRVADKEDALDGSEACTGQLGEGVGSGRGSLGVALKEEALVRVGLESRLDLTDDVRSSCRGVLGSVGGVDGVVDLAAGKLALNVGVHGAESSRRALGFTCTAGVDDGVARAGVCPLDHAGLGGGRSGESEDDVLKLHGE